MFMLGNFKDGKVSVCVLQCQTYVYTHRLLQTTESMLKFRLFKLKWELFYFRLRATRFLIREIFWYYLSISH
jgi:hypothetical protein